MQDGLLAIIGRMSHLVVGIAYGPKTDQHGRTDLSLCLCMALLTQTKIQGMVVGESFLSLFTNLRLLT